MATTPRLASGIDRDVRRDHPYAAYGKLSFKVYTLKEGDVNARMQLKIFEMYDSMSIIEQALNKLPLGPVKSNNRKFVPPPRSELGVSMEALIHHFKLWTEGFLVLDESTYFAVESPRGELGVLLAGDGSAKPRRVHWRTPAFSNLSCIALITKGHLVADLIAILASVDIVLGDIDR